MSKIKKTYDVYLSYTLQLHGQANVVAKKLADAGLSVFNISEIGPDYNIPEETWQALAESWALVALIKPGTIPPSVAVEIGAASAWQKPIYILTAGEGEYRVPVYISKYEIFKTSEIEKVIELISKGLKPLNDEERKSLVEAYVRLKVSTDRLLMESVYVERLKNILKEELGTSISGERIMQELLRLRKRGKLPKIHRKK